MNTPATDRANWSWRMSRSHLYGSLAERKTRELAELNMLYGRSAPEAKEEKSEE